MHRAIVFAHYDKDNIVDAYVYNYLHELSCISKYLVFVSTVPLSKEEITRLSLFCSKVIVRLNVGYDFMSYKIGLESFEWKDYEEIVICNDSVYGPCYPLDTLFKQMQSLEVDFWGVTDNYKYEHHLQSYFICFKKNIIESYIFKEFWKNIKVLDNKNEIIEKYEVGLSNLLYSNGFTFRAFYEERASKVDEFLLKIKRMRIKNLIKKVFAVVRKREQFSEFGHVNNTHYFWKNMLKAKTPFIKVDLLRDNPASIDIDEIYSYLESETEYNIHLIKNHLLRVKEK